MPTIGLRTRFFDHRLPSLYSGRYTVTVEHETSGDGQVDPDVLPDLAQGFEVRQPRLRLEPGDVTACYPAPASIGTFALVLPHITLTRPSLPWFHKLRGTDDGVPWCALVLFRAGELPEDPQAVGQVTVSTARQLVDGKAGSGRPPALDPVLRPDEEQTTVASVLVPGGRFTALFPTSAEMGMLSHVREGGPPDAALRADDDPQPDEDDIKAVVVANRFPSPLGGPHVAHLLSLDGFEDYLDAERPPPPEGMRMISLHSWVFEPQNENVFDFAAIVGALAADPSTRLRHLLPETADAPPELELLRLGGTALPQRLESGETSVAFYRGAFTALDTHPLPEPGNPGDNRVRLESAGEALGYVEDLGVYDASYAAAFSLGHNLALADVEFRGALLTYRKAARNAARRLLTHPGIAGRTASLSAAASAALVRENVVRRDFHRLLGEHGALATALARPAAQVTAAGRRLAPRATRVGTLGAAGLRGALRDTGVRDTLAAATADEHSAVVDWLGRLARLEAVPFEHLVPDERLLPEESLRFFHVDAAWIHAAIDGALSVGVGHALDAELNGLAVDTRGIAQPVCGVAIRSELVPHWPTTVHLTAFTGETPVEPLRTLTVGDKQILVLLYPALIDTFTIAEPPQGLHFGISGDYTLELRAITPPVGTGIADFPDDDGGFVRFMRPGEDDVLNLQGALAPALADEFGVPALSSAQLALQLVKAPQMQVFRHPDAVGGTE